MKRCLLIALIAIGLVAGGWPTVAQDPLAVKLAGIDNDGPVSQNDESVKAFDDLLKLLNELYTEGREEITDLTISAGENLDAAGVHEHLLNIMDGMSSLFEKRVDGQSYEKYLDAYMKLRQQGKSHSNAVEMLKSSIRK